MAINMVPNKRFAANQQEVAQRQAAGGTGQKFMANHPKFAAKQIGQYANYDKNQAALQQRQAGGGTGDMFMANHPRFAQRNAMMQTQAQAGPKPPPMAPPSYQQGPDASGYTQAQQEQMNQAAMNQALNQFGVPAKPMGQQAGQVASQAIGQGNRPPVYNGSWQPIQTAQQAVNQAGQAAQQGQAQQGVGQMFNQAMGTGYYPK